MGSFNLSELTTYKLSKQWIKNVNAQPPEKLIQFAVDYATFGMINETQYLLDSGITDIDWDRICEVAIQYNRSNIVALMLSKDVISRKQIVRTVRDLVIRLQGSDRISDKNRVATNKRVLSMMLPRVDTFKIVKYLKVATDIQDVCKVLMPYVEGRQLETIQRLAMLDDSYDLI
jgi:hypothetical protein